MLQNASEPTATQSLAARQLALLSWGKTTDRAARTANARAALEQKWLDQADGDPIRAAALRKAHFVGMALKSATTRRLNREARRNGGAA